MTCTRHAAYQSLCEMCHARRHSSALARIEADIAELRERTTLRERYGELRLRYSLRGADDRPIVLTDAVDADGLVMRVRLLDWETLLDAVERGVVGETE